MEFLKKNWQFLLITALAILAAWYAFDKRLSLLEDRNMQRQVEIQNLQSNQKEFVTRREIDEINGKLSSIEIKIDKIVDRSIK